VKLTSGAFLALLLIGTNAQAVPYIIHVSDAAPGRTLVISGGGYEPSKVQVILHVPGTEVRQRDKLPDLITALARSYAGQPKPLPVQPPNQQTLTLKPLHATERTVFVTMPQGAFPPGYTAIVWLRDDNGFSNPMVVNQPEAWFLLRTTSRPGELNLLCGANLVGDPYVPNYVFLREPGGRVRKLEQVERHHEDGWSEDFCIQFRIPVDLEPGNYQVFAHNNSGNEFGFTRSLSLKVATDPAFPQRLYVATDFGVKGDGFTDNRAALQDLLDKAGKEGGGIVYLPPGLYRVDETVQMRDHVTLRGAGREATTIYYGGPAGVKRRAIWFISARDVHHTAFEDLTIRTADPMVYAISYFNDYKPVLDTAIRRCRIVGGLVSVHYNINMEIGDSLFERATLHVTNMEHGWIHDNEFTSGRLRGNPVALWSSENCVIEHNRVYGSSRGFVWQNHGYLGHYHNLIDSNVVEDNRLGANAGETFLFEGSGFRWWGKPDEITANGFMVKSVAWKPDELKNTFAVVTNGRGTGQYIRVAGNNENSVRLVEPWRVMPEGEVRICLMFGVVENAFVNNRDVNCDNSMMWFGAGAIHNRIVRNRSENGLGMSVWSWCEGAKNMLVPDYFNLFGNNVIEDQGSFWLTVLGDIKQDIGIRNLNNILRDNFVADVRRKRENQYWNVWEERRFGTYRPIQSAFWMDIGRSYAADRTQNPIWIDTLIEGNYITRCDWGVELRHISGGTVVINNTFFDVKLPVIDQGRQSVIRDNQIDQPVFENPPPWAEVDRAK